MNASSQIELPITNEDRLHDIAEGLWSRYRCICGNAAIVQKRKNQFRVCCRFVALGSPGDLRKVGDGSKHSEPTPWLSSSPDAIQHWKVVCLLNRP